MLKSGSSIVQRLPPQITRPFLTVSEHLGLPPIATLSTLVLWNSVSSLADGDRTKPEHLSSLLSFTGTESEEWFYMISTAIEAKGGPLISTMLHCIQAAEDDDDTTVAMCLKTLTVGIQAVGDMLQRMRERCDPQVFYHNIRTIGAGTKGMAAAGLPQGVFYDEGDGRGRWRQYSGGSNGQSSLIQLFDIFLSVDHHAVGDRQTTQKARAGVHSYVKVSCSVSIF